MGLAVEGRRAILVHSRVATMGAMTKKVISLAELRKQEMSQRWDVRREIIIDAAISLFSKQGVSSVTIRDVAKEAGISQGTIYRYFRGRDDLFVAVFNREVGKLFRKIDEEMEKGEQDLPRRFAWAYIKFLIDNRHFADTVVHFVLDGKLDTPATTAYSATVAAFVDRLERVFASGQAPDRQTRLKAHTVLACLNGIFITFTNNPGRTREEQLKHTQELANVLADWL